MDRLKLYFGIILFSFLYLGCGTSKISFYEIPAEFRSPEKRIDFSEKYYPYLKGKSFFIDPGHGGKERGNPGFEKFDDEADINLRVSLYLRQFLIEAGASVFMSRIADTTISLADRSTIADSSGAYIFISIHHNAPATAGDIWTDYTSTYYHAREGDYDYEPAEGDLARFVQRDLSYAVRNSGGLGSFDGTYSDYIIYPGEGFSVLRKTKIPAILVECAYSTNHFEAGRLKEEEFNKIEAWGIFRGLCRYLKTGIPEIKYLDNPDSLNISDKFINVLLSDSAGIDLKSIKVYWDKNNVDELLFDPYENILTITVPDSFVGKHTLRVIAANKNGNHSFPFLKEITIVQ